MNAAFKSFGTGLSLVKGSNEDFEWYPSTPEIIAAVVADLAEKSYTDNNGLPKCTVLDCGAGDGRVLSQLTSGQKYAIEKSPTLIQSLSEDIFVVGTDFHAQVLVDKRVDTIYSNPPFSEFETWATKIITEGNAQIIYLVLPKRWRKSQSIKLALESRQAKETSLGMFDFYSADRTARGEVEVVCISLCYEFSNRSQTRKSKIDPFDLWFELNFPLHLNSSENSEHEIKMDVEREANNSFESKKELIINKGLIVALEEAYQEQLQHLLSNYKAAASLDSKLLSVMGVNINAVKGSLKLKITSLKDVYWRKLFDNLDTITSRLASSQREHMLSKLFSHTHVDFTYDNAHAMIMWVIKNANNYIDLQLINCVTGMTEKANVTFYKSNQRTFQNENWRYLRNEGKIHDYGLDYRIVLTSAGGLDVQSMAVILSSTARDWITDICAVAYNLGFDTYKRNPSPSTFDWSSKGAKRFVFHRSETGTEETLFEVRAFFNGNLHFKFNKEFICKLNVEFGRLKGWIKSPADAARELDIAIDTAEQAFNSNMRIEANACQFLLTSS